MAALTSSSCSLIMASLFAYSASVQLNDPDWYLWFPLYALASASCSMSSIGYTSGVLNRWITRWLICCALLLFAKVVVEDHVYGIAGIWSLDLEERVVREKLGSGLVVASMFLQLQASMTSEESGKGQRCKALARCAEYGMAMLVVASMGLTLWFFSFVKEVRR